MRLGEHCGSAAQHADYRTVHRHPSSEWLSDEGTQSHCLPLCIAAAVLGVLGCAHLAGPDAQFFVLQAASVEAGRAIRPSAPQFRQATTTAAQAGHALQARVPQALHKGMHQELANEGWTPLPDSPNTHVVRPSPHAAGASAISVGMSILGFLAAAVAIWQRGNKRQQHDVDDSLLLRQVNSSQTTWAVHSVVADKGSVHLVGAEDPQQHTVAAFYKFVLLDDYQEMQPRLQKFCEDNNIFGTILLAKEGVNSTVAGSADSIAALLAYLRSDPRLATLTAKFSEAEEAPFRKMKVRLKKEIVTMGVEDVDPANGGEYVTPKDWNAGISDPEALVIDVRNDYEHRIGTFVNAVNPKTQNFREFPKYVESLQDCKDKKVYMSCTGGIRCEKAAAYMKQQGFKHVYQLEGGVLKYLEEIPESESMWKGQCYVFDRRVAVKHGLEQGDYEMCFACGEPMDDGDKESDLYEAGVSCPRCYDKFDEFDKERFRERMHQMRLAQQRLQAGSAKASEEAFASKLWRFHPDLMEKDPSASETTWAMHSVVADKGSVHLVGAEDPQQHTVAAFYKFVLLDDYQEMQPRLQKFCEDNNIFGTILLAKEGVNSTVAGSADSIAALLAYLRSDPRLATLTAKFSDAEEAPFRKMKVRLKKEIVTMGVEDVDPANGGEYVTPKDWNAGISDPEALVIDVRNDYEHRIGTFVNAVNPKTQNFREFPKYVESLQDCKDKKVYMSCTGGIRCEKAAAYMKQQGFKHVYQLEGGVLKYLEEIPESESMWKGQCYVFDRRVAVKHGLEQGDYEMCFACGEPMDDGDKESDLYEAGVSCPRCYDKFDEFDKERFRERMHQMRLAQQRLQAGSAKASEEAFASKLWRFHPDLMEKDPPR